MALKYCIRFSGAGGQGLIQAARILAEAAAIYDNKSASESCSYGPEARGSASRAEIIISDEAIDYPRAETVDFLLAMTQEAYDKNIFDLRPTGTVVVDLAIRTSDESSGRRLFSAPLMNIAEEKCGKSSMANIVALGFFAEVNDVINPKAIRQAIVARIPKKSEHIYIKAYEAGINAAAKLLEKPA